MIHPEKTPPAPDAPSDASSTPHSLGLEKTSPEGSSSSSPPYPPAAASEPAASDSRSSSDKAAIEGTPPGTAAEIAKWLKTRELEKEKRKRAWIASYRANARAEYAAELLEKEGRNVRSYLPSDPERRRLQKAASRARRKVAMTPEELDAHRKSERERKAKARYFAKLEKEVEAIQSKAPLAGDEDQ